MRKIALLLLGVFATICVGSIQVTPHHEKLSRHQNNLAQIDDDDDEKKDVKGSPQAKDE